MDSSHSVQLTRRGFVCAAGIGLMTALAAPVAAFSNPLALAPEAAGALAALLALFGGVAVSGTVATPDRSAELGNAFNSWAATVSDDLSGALANLCNGSAKVGKILLGGITTVAAQAITSFREFILTHVVETSITIPGPSGKLKIKELDNLNYRFPIPLDGSLKSYEEGRYKVVGAFESNSTFWMRGDLNSLNGPAFSTITIQGKKYENRSVLFISDDGMVLPTISKYDLPKLNLKSGTLTFDDFKSPYAQGVPWSFFFMNGQVTRTGYSGPLSGKIESDAFTINADALIFFVDSFNPSIRLRSVYDNTTGRSIEGDAFNDKTADKIKGGAFDVIDGAADYVGKSVDSVIGRDLTANADKVITDAGSIAIPSSIPSASDFGNYAGVLDKTKTGVLDGTTVGAGATTDSLVDVAQGGEIIKENVGAAQGSLNASGAFAGSTSLTNSWFVDLGVNFDVFPFNLPSKLQELFRTALTPSEVKNLYRVEVPFVSELAGVDENVVLDLGPSMSILRPITRTASRLLGVVGTGMAVYRMILGKDPGTSADKEE
jgi:hypothetical protein|nr:MAG TPA: hypothetical protein [Inoviridae sp.]